MKRSIVLLTAFVASSFCTFAQRVSHDDATRIAQQFLQQKGVTIVSAPTAKAQAPARSSASGQPAFYVYNNGTDGGFVIVSADDRAESVLGYSTRGHFDYASAPAQVRAWLDGYASEIAWLRANTTGTTAAAHRAAAAKAQKYTPAAPLLGDIAWDQTWPYNLLTPYYIGTTHSATGCVATAMAQIMYYHRYPEHGVGQKTYKPETLNTEVSVDFSQSVYDWDAMLPTYDASASEASQQAVALLMRDCGVAVNMAYGEQSGSSIELWLEPLTTTFSYDSHIGYLNRNYYTQDDWDQIIRDEIDARRPVFSTGFTYGSGGHAYVFDGYDEDGLIHVNWGWSGMSNGYFRTSALTPPTQGTGGSTGGFNYKQGIIVGIQPPTEGSEDWLQIVSAERTKATTAQGTKSQTATLRLGGKLTNCGWKDATVDMGFAFYDADGQNVKTVVVKESTALAVDAYVISLRAEGIDLSALSAGEYKVCPVVRTSGGNRWFRIRDYNYAKPNSLNLTVTDEGWSFANPADYDLSASDLQSTKLYKDITARITATLHNAGEVTYSGPIKAALFSASDGTKVAESDDFKYSVVGGESTAVAITNAFSVSAGDYTLALIDENSQQLNTPVSVTVLPAPADNATLTMAAQLSFDDNSQVCKDSLALTAQLECTAGVFANDLTIYIYNVDETKVVGSFNPSFVFAEAGEKPQVDFTGTFENGQEGQTYKAVLLNLSSSAYIYPRDLASCLFTLAVPSAISNVADKTPNRGTVYTVDGRVVNRNGSLSSLAPGLYILNGKKYVVR